ncbi:hypothetical protein Tco_0508423 [Tanacetum coccineum]
MQVQEEIIDVGDSDKEDDSAQDCFVLPIWPSYSSTITPSVTTDDKRTGPREEEQVFMDDLERLKKKEKEAYEEAEALRKKFDEGASSERPSEAQPTPSPAPTSEVPYEPQTDSSPAQTSKVPIEHQPSLSPRPSPAITIPDSIPETSGENLEFPRKSFSKKHRMYKESVSKQGRKFAKGESSVQRDPLFDEMPEDTIDHMETENAQSEGRTKEMVDEDKEIDERILSTEDVLSTDKEGVSTDFEKVSTDRPIVSTDGSKVSTDRHIESTEENIEGTDEQVEGTEEHNEGTEEQIVGTEENIESTEEHIEVKKFEEVQALYEKIKRSDQDFISIGSAEDERLIKKMNEKGVDSSKDEMIKEQSKEEVREESKALVEKEGKEEENKNKRKLGIRKKMKSRKRRYIQNTSEDDSDKEIDELRLHLTIASDEEKEREHLNAVYQLVMEKYQDEMPEGFDRVLWGDFAWFKFNPDDKRMKSEEESTMALELIKFVKKILAELESEEKD